jgi:hypothetical protein
VLRRGHGRSSYIAAEGDSKGDNRPTNALGESRTGRQFDALLTV